MAKRTFTPQQKADALLALKASANTEHPNGNLKGTARQLTAAWGLDKPLDPATLRGWRDKQAGDDPDEDVAAAELSMGSEVVERYETVIGQLLTVIELGLHQALAGGKVSISDVYRLIGSMNLLQQQVNLMNGEATSREEHVHILDLSDLAGDIQELRSNSAHMRDKAIERSAAIRAIEAQQGVIDGTAEELSSDS